jgi:hypothetical protein
VALSRCCATGYLNSATSPWFTVRSPPSLDCLCSYPWNLKKTPLCAPHTPTSKLTESFRDRRKAPPQGAAPTRVSRALSCSDQRVN